MSSTRVLLLIAAMAWAACAPAPEDPALYLSPDRSSFDGRSERVVVKVRAYGVGGATATGVVRLSATVGHFVNGDEVTLSDGFATATYACSPDEEAACNGTVRIAGEWGALHASTQVSVVVPPVVVPVTWRVLPTGSLSSLLAVASSPDGSAWAVGESGTVLQLVDGAWRRIAAPTEVTLRAVALDSRGEPTIVGDEGVVLVWDGGSLVRAPLATKRDFTAVALAPNGDRLLGTKDGLLSRLHGDELVDDLDVRAPVLGLVRQGLEVWGVSAHGLARLTGAEWQNLPMPVAATLSVAQSGTDCVWLGGWREGASSTQGVIIAGPSPTWRSTTLPEPVRAFAQVPGADERFALGAQTLYRQLQDADWAEVAVPAVGAAMTSRGPGDLVIVGPPGFSLLRGP